MSIILRYIYYLGFSMIQRRYFYTLDALRSLAFLTVFLAHLPLTGFPVINFLTESGGLRVTFFFVLSGFLITYILLHEKESKGKVKLKKFFVRRALRIWPLFYAMLLFAYLTPYILDFLQLPYSSDGYTPNWLFSALFLENYMMMFTESTPNVSPLLVTWSLCIDEHFYILWGILFYLVPSKKIHWVIIISIITAVITRIVYTHYSILTIDLFSNLDYFAFGAIPAYLIIKKEHIIERLTTFSSSIKYLLTVITICTILFFSNFKIPGMYIYMPVIIGSLYGLVIAFTLPSGKNKLFISNKNILSKISPYTYGLYLFHTIFLNLFLQLFGLYGFPLNNFLYIVLLGILALGCSLIASIISFKFFESKFLLLKRYFY